MALNTCIVLKLEVP